MDKLWVKHPWRRRFKTSQHSCFAAVMSNLKMGIVSNFMAMVNNVTHYAWDMKYSTEYTGIQIYNIGIRCNKSWWIWICTYSLKYIFQTSNRMLSNLTYFYSPTLLSDVKISPFLSQCYTSFSSADKSYFRFICMVIPLSLIYVLGISIPGT